MPKLWHYAVASLASVAFFTTTTAVGYVLLLVVAAFTSQGPGGPLALPLLVLMALVFGGAVSLVVYSPLAWLCAWATRSRPRVRWLVPLGLLALLVPTGLVLASLYEASDASETAWSRAVILVGIPFWFGGAFAVHWIALFSTGWITTRASRLFRA